MKPRASQRTEEGRKEKTPPSTPQPPVESASPMTTELDPYLLLPIYSGHAKECIVLANLAAALLPQRSTTYASADEKIGAMNAAIQDAELLLALTSAFLNTRDKPEPGFVSLKAVKRELGLIQYRSVERYLRAAVPDPVEADRIWKAAKRGEPVISLQLRKDILEAHDAALRTRGAKAAAARKPRRSEDV